MCAFYCDNIDTFLDVCFLETEQEAQDLHNARLAAYKRVLVEVKAITKASNTDICFHVFTLLRTNYKELRM